MYNNNAQQQAEAKIVTSDEVLHKQAKEMTRENRIPFSSRPINRIEKPVYPMSGAFIAPNCDHRAEILFENELGGLMVSDNTPILVTHRLTAVIG